MNGVHGCCVDELTDFLTLLVLPMSTVGTIDGGLVSKRTAIGSEVEDGVCLA
jgi:hypothetical protein